MSNRHCRSFTVRSTGKEQKRDTKGKWFSFSFVLLRSSAFLVSQGRRCGMFTYRRTTPWVCSFPDKHRNDSQCTFTEFTCLHRTPTINGFDGKGGSEGVVWSCTQKIPGSQEDTCNYVKNPQQPTSDSPQDFRTKRGLIDGGSRRLGRSGSGRGIRPRRSVLLPKAELQPSIVIHWDLPTVSAVTSPRGLTNNGTDDPY